MGTYLREPGQSWSVKGEEKVKKNPTGRTDRRWRQQQEQKKRERMGLRAVVGERQRRGEEVKERRGGRDEAGGRKEGKGRGAALAQRHSTATARRPQLSYTTTSLSTATAYNTAPSLFC